MASIQTVKRISALTKTMQPKVLRKRSNTQHEQSVRLVNLNYQSTAEQTINEYREALQPEDLSSSADSPEKPALKKKEKQQLKHELFLQRLASTHAPYSKSHARRVKRKEREQIASGFQDVALALPELDGDERNVAEIKESCATGKGKPSRETQRVPRSRSGMIGEGKSHPLNEKQRKRILKGEEIRQPLLLATPEFAGNPFKALRIHAQNTLVRHDKS